jgi:uncharacterized protein YodC (DUF2158 family)
MTFVVGDKVKLKQGHSSVMTVVAIEHSLDGKVTIRCKWFDNPFTRNTSHDPDELVKA